MSKYEYKVTDAEGLWGDVKVDATTETEARAKCAEWCHEESAKPGSLLATEFDLELRS
jgi:hypothetical protein